MNVFDLSKGIIKVIKLLNRYKRVNLLGYVSAIETLAKYIDSNKIFYNFKVKSIITMSEGLSQSDRVFISDVFNWVLFMQDILI